MSTLYFFMRRSKRFKLYKPDNSKKEPKLDLPKSNPDNKIKLYALQKTSVEEIAISDFKQVSVYLSKFEYVWLDMQITTINGNLDLLKNDLKIHELIIEDIQNNQRRPKLEQYDNQKFITLELLANNDYLNAKTVYLILTKNLIISIRQNNDTDINLTTLISKLKASLTDNNDAAWLVAYISYLIIDNIIDNYFPVIEKLSESFEYLEDNIIKSPNNEILAQIHNLKQDLLLLRRTIWPMREVLSQLQHDSSIFKDHNLSLYIRDCYDHILNLMDITETYRELVSDLTNMYLSSVSNRMNEIMKVLTIISTIFIPPSFIAALYGMNFNSQRSPFNMPETNWYFGYPLCLFLMLTMVLSIYAYIKKNGWLR